MKQDGIWQKKIIISLIMLAVVLSVIYLIFNQKNQVDTRTEEARFSRNTPENSAKSIRGPEVKVKRAIVETVMIHKKVSNCIKKYLRLDEKDDSVMIEFNLSWENIHVDTGAEVLRFRQFSDDGENGAVLKALVYKEDKDGFPWKKSEGFGKDIFKLKREVILAGKVIHKESAYTAQVNNNDIFFEEINGKISRLLIDGISIEKSCD